MIIIIIIIIIVIGLTYNIILALFKAAGGWASLITEISCGPKGNNSLDFVFLVRTQTAKTWPIDPLQVDLQVSILASRWKPRNDRGSTAWLRALSMAGAFRDHAFRAPPGVVEAPGSRI